MLMSVLLVCLYTMCVPGACRYQKKTSDPLGWSCIEGCELPCACLSVYHECVWSVQISEEDIRCSVWAGVVEGCELIFMLGIKPVASGRAATSPLLNPSLFRIIFVFQILEHFKVLGKDAQSVLPLKSKNPHRLGSSIM